MELREQENCSTRKKQSGSRICAETKTTPRFTTTTGVGEMPPIPPAPADEGLQTSIKSLAAMPEDSAARLVGDEDMGEPRISEELFPATGEAMF